MNRVLIVLLTIFFFSSPAFSQEPENLSLPPGTESLSPTAEQDSLSPPPEQDSPSARPAGKPALIKPGTVATSSGADTTRTKADSTGFGEIEEYIPLFESDTVNEMLGADTISRYRTAPRVMGDTAYVEPDFSHSPSRAIILALVLPGLGQTYNQKYYKIPIVWGALAGAGYAINYNTKQYKLYSEAYALDPTDDLTERYLKLWKRYMELSYISMVAVYALQVLDAYVDAQLYSWDVTENLSMGISPSLQPLMVPGGLTGQSYGLTCSFNLRKK